MKTLYDFLFVFEVSPGLTFRLRDFNLRVGTSACVACWATTAAWFVCLVAGWYLCMIPILGAACLIPRHDPGDDNDDDGDGSDDWTRRLAEVS